MPLLLTTPWFSNSHVVAQSPHSATASDTPDIRITSPTIASPCLILMTTAQAGLTSVSQRPKQALSMEFGNSVSEMLATALFSYSTPANLPATIRTLYNAFPSAGGETLVRPVYNLLNRNHRARWHDGCRHHLRIHVSSSVRVYRRIQEIQHQQIMSPPNDGLTYLVEPATRLYRASGPQRWNLTRLSTSAERWLSALSPTRILQLLMLSIRQGRVLKRR